MSTTPRTHDPFICCRDHAIDEAEARALPLLDAVLRAAYNVSDRRTLVDDGFWVSQKEMRALDAALADPAVPDRETAFRLSGASREEGVGS